MIFQRAAANAVFKPDKMGKVSLAAASHLYVGLNCFEAGQSHEAHTHADQDKLYVVLEGHGRTIVGEQAASVGPGDVIFAPAGIEHSMSNPGPQRLVVLVILSPPPGKTA